VTKNARIEHGVRVEEKTVVCSECHTTALTSGMRTEGDHVKLTKAQLEALTKLAAKAPAILFALGFRETRFEMRLTKAQRAALEKVAARPAGAMFTTAYLTKAEQMMYRRLQIKGLICGTGIGHVKLTDAGRAALEV
jgi:pyrroline-5-carboxylate reductase